MSKNLARQHVVDNPRVQKTRVHPMEEVVSKRRREKFVADAVADGASLVQAVAKLHHYSTKAIAHHRNLAEKLLGQLREVGVQCWMELDPVEGVVVLTAESPKLEASAFNVSLIAIEWQDAGGYPGDWRKIVHRHRRSLLTPVAA